MDALAIRCRSSTGTALFVRAELVAQARHAGVWALEIPREFQAEERLLSVTGHVRSGRVKITNDVVDRQCLRCN